MRFYFNKKKFVLHTRLNCKYFWLIIRNDRSIELSTRWTVDPLRHHHNHYYHGYIQVRWADLEARREQAKVSFIYYYYFFKNSILRIRILRKNKLSIGAKLLSNKERTRQTTYKMGIQQTNRRTERRKNIKVARNSLIKHIKTALISDDDI